LADDLKHLPLEDMHVAAGAKFGGFAGWSMPLSYPAGVMKEHLHTRAQVGLFDISHMRLITVEGRDAVAVLDRACPLDAAALQVAQSKYTFLLNENAGILDDLIVTRLAATRFMVVANAGNAAADEAHLRDLANDFDCTVTGLDRVFLAVQGPLAEGVLGDLGIAGLPSTFMTGYEPRDNWFVSRSGYTGEDGFEIGLPAPDARELATRLLTDGRVLWVGLAARDSLRLEAGLCLHGQDIAADIDPVSAGLMWAVPKKVREDGRFIGADTLRDLLKTGPSQKRVGLKPDGRQPVRGGAELFDGDGGPIGRVTSGGFGPSAGHPVAMGYVAASSGLPGTRIFADVRGQKLPVDVHRLPFTPHRYRKGPN
jgi:aminomethyltransferase